MELTLEGIYKLYENDKIDEALLECDNLQKAIDDKQNKARIRYYKGVIYEDRRDYLNALKCYEDAYKLYKFIDPLMRSYEVYRAQNLLNEALEAIEKIIEEFSELYYGYNLKFNFLFNLQQYTEAEKLMEFIEENFEENSLITISKIKLLVMMKKNDEAIKLIEMNKNNLEIKYDVLKEEARLYILRNNFDKAIEILQNLHFKITENYEILYMLGSLLLVKGKITEANKVLSKLLDIEYCTDLFYLQGLYYYGLTLKYESIEKSKNYFAKLLRKYNTYSQISSNDLNILVLRAICNYEIENYEEALRLIEYIDSLTIEIPELSFISALIYKALQDEEKYMELKDKLEKEDNIMYEMLIKVEAVNG